MKDKIYKFNQIFCSNRENNILIYIQQNAMLHSSFYLETALHFSGGTTAHHQERKQLYLQHLVCVTPLLLSWKSLCVLWVAYATHSTLKPVGAVLNIPISISAAMSITQV
jgi:hypothetical protein